MPKYSHRATPQQFNTMINYIKAHPNMINGKLSPVLKRSERHALWQQLSFSLNKSAFGAKKTANQWKRVWIHLKCDVKGKIAEQERRKRNGENYEPLVHHHKKIADMLAVIPSECESVAKRLALSDEEEDDYFIKTEGNVLSSTVNNTSTPIVLSLRENKNRTEELETENSCDGSQESNPTNLEFPTMPLYKDFVSTNPKKRKRHRNETEDENLCNVVKIEKEKAATFAEIAAALTTSNENENKRLKIEEHRNRLISERNEIFRSILEHFIS
ncbi:hypothetical protein NPIL_219271 [Nephila pilipes]|uniref:Regulatory protein zeste n=1 Tax=Nephila pilipes TaxID=299642 RepID=A0A8X6Q4X2_NEPPI|nr:hypothetical protein NPIL_219271 [Nephila pilipes]